MGERISELPEEDGLLTRIITAMSSRTRRAIAGVACLTALGIASCDYSDRGGMDTDADAGTPTDIVIPDFQTFDGTFVPAPPLNGVDALRIELTSFDIRFGQEGDTPPWYTPYMD